MALAHRADEPDQHHEPDEEVELTFAVVTDHPGHHEPPREDEAPPVAEAPLTPEQWKLVETAYITAKGCAPCLVDREVKRFMEERDLPSTFRNDKDRQDRITAVVDDLKGAALESLIRSARRYDPEQSKFSTYAKEGVVGAINRAARKLLTHGLTCIGKADLTQVEFSRGLSDDSGDSSDADGRYDGRHVPDHRRHHVAEWHCLESFEHRLAQIPEEHAAVCRLVCLEGMKLVEVADTLGVPYGTVQYRLRAATQALSSLEDKQGTGRTASSDRHYIEWLRINKWVDDSERNDYLVRLHEQRAIAVQAGDTKAVARLDRTIKNA